ncbi:MAG: hypothetical protein FWD60_13405 [Candidatus Azobacteroides sp.]|nr:hypothetical protein [Candidatus Azobacteroides sp.]
MSEIELNNAIGYIVKNRNGYRDELLKILNNNTEHINELGMLGYISNGTTQNHNNSYARTWGMTDKAKDYFRLFISDLSDREKEDGRYIYSRGY